MRRYEPALKVRDRAGAMFPRLLLTPAGGGQKQVRAVPVLFPPLGASAFLGLLSWCWIRFADTCLAGRVEPLSLHQICIAGHPNECRQGRVCERNA